MYVLCVAARSRVTTLTLPSPIGIFSRQPAPDSASFRSAPSYKDDPGRQARLQIPHAIPASRSLRRLTTTTGLRRALGRMSYSGGCSTCFEVIFSVVLPPLGVFFRYGCCSSEFFISLFLTVLGYVPGIIYSLCVILRTPPEPPGIDGERPYDLLA